MKRTILVSEKMAKEMDACVGHTYSNRASIGSGALENFTDFLLMQSYTKYSEMKGKKYSQDELIAGVILFVTGTIQSSSISMDRYAEDDMKIQITTRVTPELDDAINNFINNFDFFKSFQTYGRLAIAYELEKQEKMTDIMKELKDLIIFQNINSNEMKRKLTTILENCNKGEFSIDGEK